MERKDYQIGEKINRKGLRLVCVESKNCDDCCMDCGDVYCGSSARDDGKAVKFIKIEENPIESQSETINWEQRRYELSMEAMQGMLSNNSYDVYDNSFSDTNATLIASSSIKYADEMIKQLKQK